MPDPIDSFVTLAAVLDDYDFDIEGAVTGLHTTLEAHFADYEILLVGQPGAEAATEAIDTMLRHVPHVRFLRLAADTSHDVARAAALENAIGDFVVFVHPVADAPEIVVRAVEACRSNADILLGTSAARPQSLAYRMVAPLLRDALYQLLGYQSPKNATELLCVSRQVANALTWSGGSHRAFRVRLAQSGYRVRTLEYTLADARAMPARTLIGSLRDGLRQLIFNSTHPLRWMSTLGFLGSFAAASFGVYSMVIRLLKDEVVEGWTSLVLMNSAMFALMFVILAFFGEYLGRLLNERGSPAEYSVVSEQHSSVVPDDRRVNVLATDVPGDASELPPVA